MPAYVKPRGERFGAQAPVGPRGAWRWLGTHDTEELARLAVERAMRPERRAARCRKPPVIPPRLEQVLAMVAAAPDEAFRVFTLVAAFSGLRLFEVAGLEPKDLSDDGRLVVRVGKGGYRDEESLLYEPGLEALRAWNARIVANRLCFKTAVGGTFTRQYVSRKFGPMREAAGVTCTFHALRHFHACWLLDQGAATADVSAQLRHHDHGRLVDEVYGRMRSRQAALMRLEGLRTGVHTTG